MCATVFRRCLLASLALLSAWPITPRAAADESAPANGDDAVQSYLTANGLLNRGLYDLAADEYREFLAEHPDHEKALVARYGLGVCLYRLGRHEGAINALEPLVEESDFEFAAEVLAMLGQSRLAQNEYAAAASVLARLVRDYPEHDLVDDGVALLVEALYFSGEYEKAADLCERVLRRWRESPLAERVLFFQGSTRIARSEWALAIESLETLIRRYPSSEFRGQAALLLAQCHERNGAVNQAARWYRDVLQRGGDYAPDALLGLATIEQSRGNAKQAGELLDRLLGEHADSPLRPQALLLRGRSWFQQKELDRAVECFQKVGEASGDLADQAAYWLARCALRENEPAAAAQRLGEAIRAHPDSPLLAAMRYDRAVALVQAGRDDKAVEALSEFREQHPNHEMAADALQLLASVEHKRGNFARSQDHCEAFLRQYRNHPQAASIAFLAGENEFLREDYAAALRRFETFLSDFPDDQRVDKAQFRRAMALVRLDRPDDAEAALRKLGAALEREPAFHAGLLALGEIYFERGEWAAAQNALEKYLSAGADIAAADGALLKLGLSLQRQGQYQRACQTHERLLSAFPDSEHALHARFELGQSLAALERSDEAATAFQRVLERGPQSRFAVFASNHLAAIALRERDYEEAVRLYDCVLESDPPDDVRAEALAQRGEALLAMREYAQAEQSFSLFLEQFGNHEFAARARVGRALALARLDRSAEALKAIEHAMSDSSALDDATRSMLLYEKAWCLRQLDRTDEAAVAYRQVIDGGDSKHTPHALLELAEIEAAGGHCQEAIPLLERLLDRSTDNAVSRETRSAALYRLGVCEFGRENFAEAARNLEQFTKEYPQHDLLASASFFCGEAHLKMRKYPQAVAHLSRIVESFKEDDVYGPALLRLGESLAALQRWDRSERVFGEYLRQFAGAERWYQARFGVGWARENQQRYTEAIDAYRSVVQRHKGPTAARAQFQIGECLFAQQKLDDAVRELLKVEILYAYPEWSAAALYEAGRCFEQMGKAVEARKQFQTVREKYADTKWAKLAGQRLAAVRGDALPGKGSD